MLDIHLLLLLILFSSIIMKLVVHYLTNVMHYDLLRVY